MKILMLPLLLSSTLLLGQTSPPIAFQDVTKEAGLIDPILGIMGHGGAAGDFDGDGLIDLYVGGFCDRPNAEYAPAKSPPPNRLLRNLGNNKFAVSSQPILETFGRTSGSLFADLDNNGTLELYVANNARLKGSAKLDEPQKSAPLRHSQLFRNDKGTFVDISEKSGACPPNLLSARNIGAFDYDGDGLLDLFVVEDRFTKNPRSVLFRNKGNLEFEDVNDKVGLPNDIFGLGLAVADINGDRKPDFFVGHSNRLFVSQPDGKYREAVELKNIFTWKQLHGEDWPCGAAFGDLNGDGLLDLVVSIHCTKARNKVFLNRGVKDGMPVFIDATEESGLAEIVPARCPHVEIQDFDNDGLPDIYMSAGWLENDQFTPLIYRNQGVKDGKPRFVPNRPIAEPMVYYPAGPAADYDGDGKMDLFLINWFQGNHSRLLKNASPAKNWLDVQVVGKKMNRMGIGAVVTLTQGKKIVGHQEVTVGYGYASGQPAICHFGLGDLKEVDVKVVFPDGSEVTRAKVDINKRLVIEQQ